MNKVLLIGRLTHDPETRYSQAAEPLAVCRFSIAAERRYKREGEQEADFINCAAFGKTGEFIGKYFVKGMKIGLCGRLQVKTVVAQDGQKRTYTNVVVEEAEFVEKMRSSNTASQPQPQPQAVKKETSFDDDRGMYF